jgi:OPT oligopeptide transporter protein
VCSIFQPSTFAASIDTSQQLPTCEKVARWNPIRFFPESIKSKLNEQIKEKAVIHEIEETDQEEFGGKRETTEEALAKLDVLSGNPFPEDPVLRNKETRQCTIRSVAIGTFLGTFVAAGNMYISWKTGFSLDAGPLAVFAGFGMMRLMQNRLPMSFGGGFFGPKENVSCQSAANGACSGGGIFAAAYLVLSQLEFTSQCPRNVYAQTFVITKG